MIPIEYFMEILPKIFLISFLLTIVVFAILRKIFKYNLIFIRYIFIFFFIAYLQSLYVITIDGLTSDIRHKPNFYPFISIFNIYEMGLMNMVKQIALNIGLFIPLGFLLPSLFRVFHSVVNTLLVTLITTISIEVIQYFIGRSADIDDVIMNFFGGIIGYILYIIFMKLICKKNITFKK